MIIYRREHLLESGHHVHLGMDLLLEGSVPARLIHVDATNFGHLDFAGSIRVELLANIMNLRLH